MMDTSMIQKGSYITKIGAVIVIISLILLVISIFTDELITILGGILAGIGVIIMISGVSTEFHEKKEAQLKLVNEMIENGSRVYLDGQEINLDKIILENYEVTIKDDIIILNR